MLRVALREAKGVAPQGMIPQSRKDGAPAPDVTLTPIGVIRSVFPQRNGTPRQGSLAPSSRAHLKVKVATFEARHALEGLEGFSHVWLLGYFHENTNAVKNAQRSVKAKVRPPRLDGKKVGLFATRTPHRVNALSLTCARLVAIKDGDTLVLGGVDLVEGTPILDIKPAIPRYDAPGGKAQRVPAWVGPAAESGGEADAAIDARVQRVSFLATAEAQMRAILADDEKELNFYGKGDYALLRQAIAEIVALDPRASYQRDRARDVRTAFHGFCIDRLNVQFAVAPQPDGTAAAEVRSVEFWENLDESLVSMVAQGKSTGQQNAAAAAAAAGKNSESAEESPLDTSTSPSPPPPQTPPRNRLVSFLETAVGFTVPPGTPGQGGSPE